MKIKNSIINIVISLVSQVLTLIIAFPVRMIFINTLGIEYLGVNGLFTNILSILSIAELGIGSAITFSLYKPIAEDNKTEISGIMNLYAKIYKIIGIVIFLLGIILIPFLGYIVGSAKDIPNLILIYLLFLINSSISYFLSYKRSIIIAYEKSYIINMIHSIVLIIMNIGQAVVLINTKNYILYLVIQLISNFGENVIITIIANLRYKFLTSHESKKAKLDIKIKREIIKNIRALVVHKLGSITVLGTDNIIISTFVGVIWVGLYSNYCLIVNAINAILNQVFNSLTASVGNLNVTADNKKRYEVFCNILFINFWVVSFSTVALYNLLNPFIGMWLGTKYIIESKIVLCIVINFYITAMRQTTLMFKSASGLFWQDRYKPLIESILNILLSIILALKLGVSGVLLGTIISSISTNVWIEPYVLYKYSFKLPLKNYFKKYIIYTGVMIISMFITNIIVNLGHITGIIKFIYNTIICVIVPNTLYFIIFRNNAEFKFLFQVMEGLYCKLLKRKRVR